MNAAVIGQVHEGQRSMTRWIAAGIAAAALFVALLLHSAPVGAAEPDGEAIWCGGQYTNYCPLGNAGYLGGAYFGGYNGFYGYNGLYNNAVYGYRQYTDNRTNCPDGQVTQTGGGYFCTNYGTSAFVVNGATNAPYVYNGGFYGGGYPFAYTGGYYPYTYAGGYYPYYYGGVYRTGVVGVPYSGQVRVAEVAAPVAAPAPEVAAAPAAAPVVTAAPAVVDAPVAAPAQSSGTGTHAQGVAAPAAPAVAPETSGPDSRS